MRILLCGDDRDGLVELAQGLTKASAEVSCAIFVAGAGTEAEVDSVAITYAERADFHSAHWQKSASVQVREKFRDLLTSGEFDLVHVLSWRGLTRDLVTTADALCVPAVVSLEDDWATCLLERRVRPGETQPCTETHSAGTCLACARTVPPRTVWVALEAEFMAFATRAKDVRRELELARAIFVKSADDEARLRSQGEALDDLEVTILDERDSNVLVANYERIVTDYDKRGNAVTEPVWYEERMQKFAEEEWDRQCGEAGA